MGVHSTIETSLWGKLVAIDIVISQKHLSKVFLMSTHNIVFIGKLAKKIINIFCWKKVPYLELVN